MKLILGIDPGLTGAIALIGPGQKFHSVEDMFVMPNGKKSTVKNQINSAALATYLRAHRADIAFAVLEQVNTMPGQGIATNGSLMHSLGCIEGVLATLEIPVHMVHPARWKKALGLTKDKDSGRTMAQRLFPSAPLARMKDHNRADALLLAYYGTRRDG